MFMIIEYIENEDMKLTNSKCTTNALNKGADNFFTAHIQDKDRYQLLVHFYALFILRIVTKTKKVGFTKIADRL